MTNRAGVTIIKKYANRRLYNTGSSSYVTLDDLAQMVKRREDFLVVDAKSDDDITHIVLTQILLEQESKPGNGILPISVLRNLISLYGEGNLDEQHEALDRSLAGLSDQPIRIYSKMRKSFGDTPLAINLPNNIYSDRSDTRRPEAGEIDELRRELAQLQNKLEKFS